MKPRHKTSEFWFTIVSFVFSGLYLSGVLQNYDQKEDLIATFSHAAESIFLVGTQVIILSKYIKARSKEKEDSKKININTASIIELTYIPGVGTYIAKKIVEYREKHGGFSTIEELTEVDGIGDTTLEIAIPKITL